MKYKKLCDHPVYGENPFDLIGITKNRGYFPGKTFHVTDPESNKNYSLKEALEAGDLLHDNLEYRKVFLEGIGTIKDFSSCELRVFCYILYNLKKEEKYITLIMNDVMFFSGYGTRVDIYRALSLLLEKGIIARMVGSMNFFVNPNVIFNGDRRRIK